MKHCCTFNNYAVKIKSNEHEHSIVNAVVWYYSLACFRFATATFINCFLARLDMCRLFKSR